MLLLQSEAMVIRIGIKKQISTKHAILLFAAILIPGYKGEIHRSIFCISEYTFIIKRMYKWFDNLTTQYLKVGNQL